jgi:hypothetical protein
MKGSVEVDAKGYRPTGDDSAGRLLRVAAAAPGNLSFVLAGAISRKFEFLAAD